jgi:hypothetical protein
MLSTTFFSQERQYPISKSALITWLVGKFLEALIQLLLIERMGYLNKLLELKDPFFIVFLLYWKLFKFSLYWNISGL